MKDNTIKCDGCGSDLTYATNSVDYLLELRCLNKSFRVGAVTDMMICPPIDKDAHFCDIGCLTKWLVAK